MEEHFFIFPDQYHLKLLILPQIMTISTFHPNLEGKKKKRERARRERKEWREREKREEREEKGSVSEVLVHENLFSVQLQSLSVYLALLLYNNQLSPKILSQGSPTFLQIYVWAWGQLVLCHIHLQRVCDVSFVTKEA